MLLFPHSPVRGQDNCLTVYNPSSVRGCFVYVFGTQSKRYTSKQLITKGLSLCLAGAVRTIRNGVDVMDFMQIYHFLFETPAGVGLLVGASLVICIIICIIWEIRTRKIYQDRGPTKDEWALFDDEEEEGE